MEPVKAIKIATINAARHFRIDHLLGALSPGRFADIVLLKDLNRIRPEYVFKAGAPVATGGKLNREISGEYPDFLKSTVTLSPGFRPSDFTVPAEGDKAKVRVINLYPDQIISLSFVSLPTVPELGLTDQGLISVKAHRKIPVVVG
jgi:adenine deaminase